MDDDRHKIEELESEEDRLITYAHSDGKLYAMTIPTFVTLQTARALQQQGILTDDITPELVSEGTGPMAEALIEDGWFTADEFVASWAAEIALNLDDELREMGDGK